MQVNRVTWRSIYDIKGLNGDMSYNGNAGAEILHYYLTRFAIPKKEDKQVGGHLARATYSAYNTRPADLPDIAACVRALLGKLSTRRSGPNFKRSAPARNSQ